MDIYEPEEDSFLLQEEVVKYAQGKVLDLGTGSGIQALTAVKNKEVKEVIAVDINPDALKQLQEKVDKEKIKKIMVIKSDLFSEVEGKFDTIIFNPPYLPQDKGITDAALYGGKRGWEISKRFFEQVSAHLTAQGKILFLFSSLTNKDKIDEIIAQSLLESQLLREKKIAFERLYVYLVKKSKLLLLLERKGIERINYFSHGKRGNIFVGFLDQSKLIKTYFSRKEEVKVAIKVKRETSKAVERIKNEAVWLNVLNQKGIGPKLLFYGNNYLVYEFVDGIPILDWIHNNSKGINCKNSKEMKELKELKEMIILILKEVLRQCLILDQLKVDKEEMHHPLKHILINSLNQPTLIDFERCHWADKAKNVTQFVEFICRIKEELGNKGLKINVERLRNLAQSYKKSQNEQDQQKIILRIFEQIAP